MSGTDCGLITHESVPVIFEPPYINFVLWQPVVFCKSYAAEGAPDCGSGALSAAYDLHSTTCCHSTKLI